MACYDFDYAILLLRQAVDFAEIEHEFVPLRKWVNEVEQSGHENGTIEARDNHATGQEFLLMALQLVAAGSLSPEDADQRIHRWLERGQMKEVEAKLVTQYQFA